jgi:hypothetical protein
MGARPVLDLTGRRFGSLSVVNRVGADSLGKTTWLCLCDCGKTTVAAMGNLRSRNTKSCGCLKHRRGPRSSTDPLAKTARKGQRNASRSWRAWVLRRDPRCLQCGTAERLEAHHLEGFSETPLLRYRLDNGATLCHDCHGAFHKRYGRQGFTEADFVEFLVGFRERPPIICVGVSGG